MLFTSLFHPKPFSGPYAAFSLICSSKVSYLLAKSIFCALIPHLGPRFPFVWGININWSGFHSGEETPSAHLYAARQICFWKLLFFWSSPLLHNETFCISTGKSARVTNQPRLGNFVVLMKSIWHSLFFQFHFQFFFCNLRKKMFISLNSQLVIHWDVKDWSCLRWTLNLSVCGKASGYAMWKELWPEPGSPLSATFCW